MTEAIIKSPKVLVVGASYDSVNNNSVLRKFVAEGFEEILGKENVLESDLFTADLVIKSFIPDLVLVFGSCMPDESSYSELRKVCDKHQVPIAFWLHDDPYELDFKFKAEIYGDFLFSNDRWAAEFYSKKCHHLPMAASVKYHYRDPNSFYENDIFFCGVAFDNRKQLISDLQPVLQTMNTLVLGADWPAELEFAKNQRISNQQFGDYCSRSKFVLNIGRHLNLANKRFDLIASTPGPRTFEAAMSGCVQLFYVESLEILDYYEPGEEILLFNNKQEFCQQIEKLIDDESKLREISIAAQNKTTKFHTYKNRAEKILNIVLNM